MEYQLKEFHIDLNLSRIANLHYFEFTGQYHTVSDCHNFYELLYVDRGTITVSSQNYSGKLYDNQLLIHSPNELHSLDCDSDLAPNVIIIGFECDCDALSRLAGTPVTLSDEQKKMLTDVMKEGMSVFIPPYDLPNTLDMKKRQQYPFGADQMLKIRLEILLISLIRSQYQPMEPPPVTVAADKNVSEIYQYIRENYMQKITLDNICFLFGTNKTTLCQNFKHEYGMTVLECITKFKISEAKKLLRENKLSVTEISQHLGFNSIHYFCRAFKKYQKQTPTEYLRSIRAKLDL